MSRNKIQWLGIPMNRRRMLQGSLGAAMFAAMPKPGRAQSDTVLRIRDYAEPGSLDPAYAGGVNDEIVYSGIYSKLIQYKPGADWEWKLDAAQSIEQDGDKAIRFTLRDDVGFTNGFGQLTAEDVKFSFERMVDPKTEAVNKPDWGPLSHVEVHDKLSGTIVFNEPFQPVWNITLPYIAGNILSKKAMESVGGKLEHDPVATSGPYLWKSWDLKQKITLTRNPDWYGEPRDFEQVQVVYIDDEKTAEIAYEAGDIDMTRISLASLDTLKQNLPAGTKLEEFPSLYYVWVGLNLENPKFEDLRVRQAIQYAIDVPSIMEAAYFGVAQPSTGIIAPGLIGHREESLIPPEANFEKAKALLDEAGVSGLSVTLDVLNKTANVTAAQIIQATLAQVGITVEVNVHESGAFWSLGDASAGDRWKEVEMIMNRFSMTPDPYYATAWFTTEQVGIWNWERFSNEEFDRLHQEAKGETDLAKRDQMYRRMQDMMEESGAYRFLTHEANPVMYRDTIKAALRPDGLPLLRDFAKI